MVVVRTLLIFRTQDRVPHVSYGLIISFNSHACDFYQAEKWLRRGSPGFWKLVWRFSNAKEYPMLAVQMLVYDYMPGGNLRHQLESRKHVHSILVQSIY